MRKILHELHTIALAPMEECPPGREIGWLHIILQAMGTTYQFQCCPQPDIDEAHLAELFDVLAAQWLQMRDLAVQRGVTLPFPYAHPVSVQEWRILFCEADAGNLLADVLAAAGTGARSSC